MQITNITVITLGVTAICLFILLLFPYILYARDMKDHLRTGKTFMESVTSTVIWHLLLCFFFYFFFYVWSLASIHLSNPNGNGKDGVFAKYSPQAATYAFLGVGRGESDLFGYWKTVIDDDLKSQKEEGDTKLIKRSNKFVKYSIGLIVMLGLLYCVVLAFLPLSCVLVPLFLSARYDKLNKNEGATMLTNKARYLVYGVAVYVIFVLHLKINDIFINGVLGENGSVELHGEIMKMVKHMIRGN